MLRHYIKVALRLIRRSLLFSSINLMGFVLGLTAAFLIYLWVVDELTHDDCFRDGSRIYRVTELRREAGGEVKESPRLPRTLAMDFRQKFPQVEDATAIKYGDLSNQPYKDYIFDIDRFTAFEGNTGPYILYTIVRIKSILSRYGEWENLPIQEPANDYAKDLMLAVTKFGPALEGALKTSSPNLICAYVYELAGCVNKFYHETPILKEEDETVKAGHIALIGLAKNILEASIDLLGFHAPEKM